MHLAMAIFWLIVGVGILLWPFLHPEGGRLEIGNTGVSFAWFAFALGVYNFIRWLLWRAHYRQRELEAALRAAERPRRQSDEYHPEFDFSDKPPESR
ncbi:MAG: hypothetical protein L0Y72_08290 [Gemmataceae bacterium]|nr:hypothetical protein [Gemmataceae bacterium]MCI0739028.1 hypothetical protein [Gemmataceae bacterium]